MDGVLWNFSINQNLKNHVKLKTGVIMLKIQLCQHRNTLHIKYKTII